MGARRSCGQLIKHLSSSNKCTTKWEWVEGHSVERKGWRNCSIPEWLNHQADEVAKNALISGLSGGSTKEGDFPFETPQACRHKGIWTNPPSSGSGLGVSSSQGIVCFKGDHNGKRFPPCVVGWPKRSHVKLSKNVQSMDNQARVRLQWKTLASRGLEEPAHASRGLEEIQKSLSLSD